MFRPLLNTEGKLQSSALKKVESSKRKIVLLWPISPVTLALLSPLLPTSLYLNKGYTVSNTKKLLKTFSPSKENPTELAVLFQSLKTLT